MRAGLAASTVTPGRTAPDVSLTTPAMVAWAYAVAGIDEIKRIQHVNRVRLAASSRICAPSISERMSRLQQAGERRRMSDRMIRQESNFVDLAF
jgi:hypothetical protein